MTRLAEFALILLVAAAASLALNRALAPLLARYALACPNARSSHSVPTPGGGGIAVVLAIFLAMLAAALLRTVDTQSLVALWPVAAGVVLLAVTGVCDDIFQLPVGPRFVLQVVAVAATLAVLPDGARVVPALPWWVERAALLVAGVYLVNVVNFMDGIDWITVAEVVPVTVALWIASLLGALSPADGALALAVAGAMLGFARALGDYGATMFFAGARIEGVPTGSIAVMDYFYGNHEAEARRMSLVMTVVGVAMLYLANRLTRRMLPNRG